MCGLNSESVDLIYLDPPFNSKSNYAAPIGSPADGASFKDTWSLTDLDVEWINLIQAKHPALHRVLLAAMTPGDKSYLVYMAVRLLEMRRLLKSTGSIYLHCDPTMSHYLKLVMDAVFGKKRFRNEVVWCYKENDTAERYFPKKHDVLLVYAKDPDACKFNIQRGEITEAQRKRYNHVGEDGNLYANMKGKMRMLRGGARVRDWWPDIPIAQAAERVSYPTQKPLALLHRIILAASDEGDMVLDPFCGCATACIAAEQKQRQWAGIDISPKAAELVKSRMRDELQLLFQGVHRTDIPTRTDEGDLPRYNHPDNKKRLYGEQGGYCNGCKTHFPPQHLHVDHIVAQSKGGGNHIENLQLLCPRCNSIKGDRGMEYLMATLQINA